MASSNDSAEKMEKELDEQNKKAAAEAAKKLQALTSTRLQIVKSAGGQDWNNVGYVQPSTPTDEG